MICIGKMGRAVGSVLTHVDPCDLVGKLLIYKGGSRVIRVIPKGRGREINTLPLSSLSCLYEKILGKKYAESSVNESSSNILLSLISIGQGEQGTKIAEAGEVLPIVCVP